MKKFCLKISLVLFSLLIFLNTSHAASLSLTWIGGLNTAGKNYTEWWYTGINPVLKGTAGSAKTVDITIGTTKNTVTADSSGNWTFAATLPKGDHIITLLSESITYKFTLHTGQDLPANAATSGTTPQTTASATAVPATGYSQLQGIIISTLLIIGGMLILNYQKKNKKRFILEDIIDSL